MTLKTFLAAVSLTLISPMLAFSNDGSYQVTSPDGQLRATVVVSDVITYTVARDAQVLIAPSEINMTLSDGIVFGVNDKVKKVRNTSVDQVLPTIAYKKAEVVDRYNEMTLEFKEFSLVFRAYDEGVAYRFVSKLKSGSDVVSEKAEFAFAKDWTAYIPYVRQHAQSLETQFYNSFENTYAVHPLSGWNKERLAFAPVAVAADGGVKVLITEADLMNYPGMFLYNEKGGSSLSGRFAGYPKEVKQGGHNRLQMEVQSRENYIAKASAAEKFPWRVIMVTANDADLAVNDMVWKLSTPQDPEVDYSWVRPGKVAWDWWNDWNVYGVDFRAGINNDTYKYYIDFAAANGIEYVILDEGWAVNLQADLMQVIPEIDLPMLTEYARERGVGLILWAGYWAFDRDMENVCKHYYEMGIKGFKVDFMDRDDQQMTDFNYRAAAMAAKYKLVLDLHGTHKPAGLNRTYPNVLNFEGVHGLEQMKWNKPSVDQMKYDAMIPFIRQVAGPMDYTQGAMRNAAKGNYYPCNSEPMSQGTRCHQLALYVVLESPLNMMCDSPSNYMKEPESTRFIADIPTTWDESVVLDGKMGEYVVTARRKGTVWYVGGITDWTERDVVVDCSLLNGSAASAVLFRDGANAHRAGSDYKLETIQLKSDSKLKIHLAPGGGFALQIGNARK